MTTPELEPRCLLCDAVFAEPPVGGRPVSRCKECARQVYSDSTMAGETRPAEPATSAASTPPADAAANIPKNVVLFELEGITEEPLAVPPTSPATSPAAAPEIPVVRPHSESQGKGPSAAAREDLPVAKPLPSRPSLTLPEWATSRTDPAARRPETTSPRAEKPRAATHIPGRPSEPLPALPDADRPQPQYGKALFVVAILTLLALGAFLMLAYAIIQGLKVKGKRADAFSPSIMVIAGHDSPRAVHLVEACSSFRV